MSAWADVGLTILGGALVAGAGVVVFFVQRGTQRKDAKEERELAALSEFSEALMPLVIELDRWVGRRGAVWVGDSRQLAGVGTWIFDPESNASRPPDWEATGHRSQAAERLWRDRLQARVSDPAILGKWDQVSGLLFHLTRKDGAGPRDVAEQAEAHIVELLEMIKRHSESPHSRDT